jgi:hypothetical protein
MGRAADIGRESLGGKMLCGVQKLPRPYPANRGKGLALQR